MIKKLINKLRCNYGEVPNPKSSDVYLVSYPKSGNTWLRYLLAYSIWPNLNSIDLVKMADYIPSVGLKNDYKSLKNKKSACNQEHCRIIKSHVTANSKSANNIKKVIYLIRDGRDAVVSYWHFCNQRDKTNISLSEFIKISATHDSYYGAWSEHLSGWLEGNSNLSDILVVTYEDLLNDTPTMLKKILEFTGYSEIDDLVINNAVEKASFTNMKKLESSQGLNLKQLRNVNFVREGKVGGWANVFDNEQYNLFVKYHAKNKNGYYKI